MADMRLIPYSVGNVVDEPNEIPEGVRMIKAPSIWKDSDMGEGVVVAVLDTGCQTDHPDLRDRIIGGRNFTSDYGGNPYNFYDNHYHGTHVAGTIAASYNGQGVAGVAPKAKLLILKVVTSDGSSSYQNLIDGINYATNWRGPRGEKVSVMSMSLGGSKDDPDLHKAIKRAVENDLLVVCAAGNEGDGKTGTIERGYPGYYKEVVQVGAVDMKGRLADFTNTNEEVDLVAPGVDVLSTYKDGKYAKLSGTSMATPHVSGAAALLINQFQKENGRKPSEAELYAQLIKRTRSLGMSQRGQGNGLLLLTTGNTPIANRPAARKRAGDMKGKGFVIPAASIDPNN
ncbi:S8 family peptidase [Pseudalkalibacillus caeni]|uniref:Serine protease n=1 Tax=Exobacillus caeni TaxID=2574798 RepID=A0A5R9F636_9BACL|nr:S8 family peptidase [Pseudalkalibacillus caeni]TLS37959.1 serine protease [Pseudalkalibacillus caeni]